MDAKLSPGLEFTQNTVGFSVVQVNFGDAAEIKVPSVVHRSAGEEQLSERCAHGVTHG